MHAQERQRAAEARERARRAAQAGPAPTPSTSAPAQLLRLQNLAGNVAVGRALSGGSRHLPTVQRTPVGAPPAPPPPPMPVLSRGPAAVAPAATSADNEFELPPEHVGIRSTVPDGRLPLRNKPLVRQVITRYYGVNRTDIVDLIKERYEQVNHEAFVDTPQMEALKQSHRPGYKDSDAYIAVSGSGGVPPHWPVVPGGPVKVHKGSLDAFRLGAPGTAFTGLVRFGGHDDNGAPNEPKIILFPTQSTGEYLKQGVAEHPQEDQDNPPEILRESRVYQERSTVYTTHAASGALSSHGKLAAHVYEKDKYKQLVKNLELEDAEDLQTAGLTIGFTVVKGGGSAAHKYSFVSRSSNNHMFDLLSPQEKSDLSPMRKMKLRADRSAKFGHLGLQANGPGSITKEWGEKIIASVNSAVG
ncbi:hypothetical protein [Streptomyces sp. NPDC047000]|uniref:hypothetical protein n=1 Tax=Streptomyces sp. NPDC047000 TaxID=3155474 RepID=UPI0033E3B40F